jgi:hypothetical protein
MLTTLAELSSLLNVHGIFPEALSQVPINAIDQSAFVIDIAPSDRLIAWTVLRAQIGQTGRYPLATATWGGDGDFFSRWWYEQEKYPDLPGDVSPRTILASLGVADSVGFLAARERQISEDIPGYIDQECDRTRRRFGSDPPADHMKALAEQGVIRSYIDIERWLFQWERSTLGDAIALPPEYTGYLDWFEPAESPAVIVLLPCLESWQTLAYCHWYGALLSGTATAMQLLEQWQREYQAELVCHYGTMLQFQVGRPPSTPEQAFQLAWEQTAMAECTIIPAGISLRDHARSLLALDRWFLFERP